MLINALNGRFVKQIRSLNEFVFDTLTPEVEYWLGMLMADGCVYRDYVILHLQEKDLQHIEKFKTFVNGEQRIEKKFDKKFKTTSYMYRFYSPIMAAKLASYGIVPRKSKKEKAIGVIINSRDFWRGVIDGDGSVSKGARNTSRIRLCGSSELLEQFKTFVLGFFPECKVNVNPRGSIFMYETMGRPAKVIIKYLYREPVVYLERKLIAANEFILAA